MTKISLEITDQKLYSKLQGSNDLTEINSIKWLKIFVLFLPCLVMFTYLILMISSNSNDKQK